MICVFGSANIDLIVPVRRLPVPGESVIGSDLMHVFGGKGANQAIAASRLGAEVQLVARLGGDAFAAQYVDYLAQQNIGIAHVEHSESRPTGTAMIIVEERGENVIVVSPGANQELTTEMIDRAEELVARCTVVLLQLEIPVDSVRHVIAMANRLHVPVILNPSPVAREFSLADLRVDYLVVNQVEAEILSSITSVGVENARRMTNVLRKWGADSVIMTRGANNTVVNSGDEVHFVPTLHVDPVDTVGAGDAFVGALAVGIAEGFDLDQCVRFANCAAALATLKMGAQTSMPSRAEVDVQLHLLPA